MISGDARGDFRRLPSWGNFITEHDSVSEDLAVIQKARLRFVVRTNSEMYLDANHQAIRTPM